MELRLHIPAESPLSEYITAIWEASGSRNIQETIIPQGVVEMVFNLGDEMLGQMPGKLDVFKAPLCFIQGLNTNSINVTYEGTAHLFGIRLQPGMVKGLLGIMPAELKDNLIDLTLLKPGYNILWYRLKEAPSFQSRVQIIEEEFPVLSAAVCLRTQKLCNLFLTGEISHFDSISGLSKQVHYSPRHLNRKTQSIFGISAEELVTYKKFLHAVLQIHQHNSSLTKIAYDCGFYDQAHFCKVFKSFAGITASQYKAQKTSLPFHLFSMDEKK